MTTKPFRDALVTTRLDNAYLRGFRDAICGASIDYDALLLPGQSAYLRGYHAGDQMLSLVKATAKDVAKAIVRAS